MMRQLIAFNAWAAILSYGINNEANHLLIGVVNLGIEFHVMLSRHEYGTLAEDIKVMNLPD